MATTWELVLQKAQLISLPEMYLRLQQELSETNSTSASIAKIIASDPAISMRLLQIVNSAYFGLPTQIDSISRAVNLLGTQGVYNLVLAISVTQSFKGIDSEIMDMQRFWQKSVYRAILSRELAALCNVVDREQPFLCGLLCDLGHLFMYQAVPEQAVSAINMAQQKNLPVYQLERTMMGLDYASVGAALMRRWQLPQSLWEPTEYHIEPEKSQEFQLFSSLVHIAAQVTDAPGAADSSKNVPDEQTFKSVSAIAWQVSNLTEQMCLDVLPNVDAQLNEVMQMIFPTELAA